MVIRRGDIVGDKQRGVQGVPVPLPAPLEAACKARAAPRAGLVPALALPHYGGAFGKLMA